MLLKVANITLDLQFHVFTYNKLETIFKCKRFTFSNHITCNTSWHIAFRNFCISQKLKFFENVYKRLWFFKLSFAANQRVLKLNLNSVCWNCQLRTEHIIQRESKEYQTIQLLKLNLNSVRWNCQIRSVIIMYYSTVFIVYRNMSAPTQCMVLLRRISMCKPQDCF